MTNSTTSGLDNTTALDGDDLLLVSKKSGDTYLSRNVKYSVIKNSIDKVVTDLSPIINSKANQSDLVTTNDLVNTKANQADLIVTNDLVNTKASQVSLDAINDTVNQKANTVDVYSKTDLSMTKRIQDANEAQLGAGANGWADLLVATATAGKVNQQQVNDLLYTSSATGTYTANLVDQSLATTPNSKLYLVKGKTRPFIGVGWKQGNKTFEFTLKNNDDGLMLVEYGYAGNVIAPSTTVQASNVRDDSGAAVDIATISGSGDNKYFASSRVGHKFDVVFNGTGLIFRYYSDANGGLWKVTVDGSIIKNISTYSSPGISDNKITVVEGLVSGSHTAVFEFMGQDPSNPVATPRGWFKYDDGAAPTVTTGIVLTGNEYEQATTGRSLVVAGIIEFAISAKPMGSAFATDWVPAHGSSTGCSVRTAGNIYIDDITYGLDLAAFPADSSRTCDRIVIEQQYTAYNSNDSGKTLPMWSGILIHSFDKTGLTITNKITTLRDLQMGDGYCAMVSARNTFAAKFKANNGVVGETLGVGSSNNVGFASSAMFYNTATGLSVAVAPLSVRDSINMDKNFAPLNPTLRTDRADGFGKIYWKICETNAIIPANTVITSSHRIFPSNKKLI